MKTKTFSFGILAALVIGCSSSGVPDSTKLNETVVSVWKPTEGSLFSESTSGDLQYLELKSDGTATFYRTVGTTGIITCETFLFGVTSDKNLLFDRGGIQQEALTELYSFTQSEDSLVIQSTGSKSVTLTKAAAVPDANICQSTTPTATFDLTSVQAGNWTNLVWDGSSLWFTGSDSSSSGRFPVNPTTGAVGSVHTFGFGVEDNLITMEGSDYWNVTPAGDSNPIARRTSSDALVDTIHTNTDLNKYIDIKTGAFDGTYLWLYGRSRDDNKSYLLEINADPPLSAAVLVKATEYPSIVQALTYDGSAFWAIASGPNQQMFLVKIDPLTLVATKTLVLPKDDNKHLQGIAAANSQIYVLSESGSGTTEHAVIDQYTP